jgi:hypothetical protein
MLLERAKEDIIDTHRADRTHSQTSSVLGLSPDEAAVTAVALRTVLAGIAALLPRVKAALQLQARLLLHHDFLFLLIQVLCRQAR